MSLLSITSIRPTLNTMNLIQVFKITLVEDRKGSTSIEKNCQRRGSPSKSYIMKTFFVILILNATLGLATTITRIEQRGEVREVH